MASLPLGRSTQRPGVLTASALKVGFRDDGRLSDFERRLGLPWQARALRYYTEIGEVRYASHFYSRMMKRLRIYPAFQRSDGGRPEAISEGPPAELLDRIHDPGGGRSKILGDYGRLIFVTGECYLFGRDLGTEEEKWSVVWRGELDFQDNGVIVWRPASQIEYMYGPGEAIAYRMWTPHPAQSYEADSPMQGVLEICDELLILSRSVRATAVSRIANNGILLMPQEISPPPIEAGSDEDPLSDPFMSEWIEHMHAAMENIGTAEAAAPLMTWAAAEYIDKVRHIKMREPADDYAERDLRTEAVKRLALGFDMPPEELLGMAQANHWCQTSQTQVMAYGRGWITQDQLSVGDMVLTLNHEGGVSEWQPVEDIYRAEVVDEPMYAMKSRAHSSVSTPNHRWPIIKTGYKVSGSRRRWTTSADGFAALDVVPVAAPLLEEERVRVHRDELVQLLVAYISDGTLQAHGNIRIVKFSEREIDLMQQILTALFGVDGFRTNPHHTHTTDGTAFVLRQAEAGRVLDLCTDHKVISLDFVNELTSRQRQLLLDSCVEIGDGVERDGATTLYQVNEAMLEPFAYAAHLCGYKVMRGRRNSQTGFGTTPLSWIKWNKARVTFNPWSCEQEIVLYTGTIWCPVTKNSTWLAMHNGTAYYTGNTAWQIKDETWQSHGAPIAEQFCDDLNEAYLRPALREEGYERWREVVIRYDAAEVVINPDRSDDANEAWDRGAISYAAYRRMKNIPEQDAMQPDERDEWLALKLRNPAMLGLPEDRVRQPEPAADGVPTDGPDAVRERTGRAASVIARELGAADLALLRCRELAGIRLRQKAKSCPDCLSAADGSPNALVASRVGAHNLERLGFHDVRELVSGGADGLRTLLREWGYEDAQAVAFAEMIEIYASRTVFHDAQPTLPASFEAHLERIKEVSSALARD